MIFGGCCFHQKIIIKVQRKRGKGVACYLHYKLQRELKQPVSAMQGRVTDHRVGITEHNLDAVLTGERLKTFTDSLIEHYNAKMLEQLS